MHVCFEQGEAHFFHGGVYVCFGELSAFAQIIEDLVEASGESFKHIFYE